MPLYNLVFAKACHISFELEHKSYWVIQKLNFDAKTCEKRRLLELNNMDEFRLDAYKNAAMYKEPTKLWYDKHILAQHFEPRH